MTETTEETTAKLSTEELDAIDLTEFNEEKAAALHGDDLLYLLKRKLRESSAGDSLSLLAAMLNDTAGKVEGLATVIGLGDMINMDFTEEPARTALSSIAKTMDELKGFIEVVVERFGKKEND